MFFYRLLNIFSSSGCSILSVFFFSWAVLHRHKILHTVYRQNVLICSICQTVVRFVFCHRLETLKVKLKSFFRKLMKNKTCTMYKYSVLSTVDSVLCRGDFFGESDPGKKPGFITLKDRIKVASVHRGVSVIIVLSNNTYLTWFIYVNQRPHWIFKNMSIYCVSYSTLCIWIHVIKDGGSIELKMEDPSH